MYNIDKMPHKNTSSLTMRLIESFIWLAILVNSVGMFFPSLSSTFTPYYGSIAKNIAITNNWTDLILIGQDWLDKPHFPFWITAFFYKLFGINPFAYIISGFIFHLIGLAYTYKLAKYWYDKNVAIIACLMYTTSLHLMQSAIDVRAEAYLLGQIIPACYYWLLYDKQTTIKNLFLGSLFTALAIMTKGIFVLITIISGIAVLWFVQKRLINFIRIKWIGALALSLALTLPELISLYYQFDLHPEKVVFGQTHVSGISWFFWDSQFGRFFNTGPIMSTNPSAFHYLYFVHTFLWAFLPWWPIFFIAIYDACKNFYTTRKLDEAKVYLVSSFFITFILFSVTTFQVDHYTNIIFPFACIICASWIVKINEANRAIYTVELLITWILITVVLFISSTILSGLVQLLMYALVVFVIINLYLFKNNSNTDKILIFPSMTIMVTFVCIMCLNGIEYAKYDSGYQIAQYLNQRDNIDNISKYDSNKKILVIGYNVDLKSLNLNLDQNHSYIYVSKLEQVTSSAKPFYIVTKLSQQQEVEKYFLNVLFEKEFIGSSIEGFVANKIINRYNAFNASQNTNNNSNLDYYVLFKSN